jgi:hypothetical protein
MTRPGRNRQLAHNMILLSLSLLFVVVTIAYVLIVTWSP